MPRDCHGMQPLEAKYYRRLRRSPALRSALRRSGVPGGGPRLAFRRSFARRSRARRSVFSVKAAFRVASLSSRCRRTVRRAGSSTSNNPSCATRACASTGGLPKRSRRSCAAFRIDSRCQLCSGLIRKMPESAISLFSGSRSRNRGSGNSFGCGSVPGSRRPVPDHKLRAKEKCSSPFSGRPWMLRRMMRLARYARAASCAVPKANN
jgi:hypothetical protein